MTKMTVTKKMTHQLQVKGRDRVVLAMIRGKKSKSGFADMQDQVKRIVELCKMSHASFQPFVQKREQDSVCSINDVMALVEECGVVSETNEHFIKFSNFHKGVKKMFMTLRNSEA